MEFLLIVALVGVALLIWLGVRKPKVAPRANEPKTIIAPGGATATRVAQSRPSLELIADNVSVVGIQHRGEDANEFIKAANHAGTKGKGIDDLSIRLEREPENEFDPYAIKVYGEWAGRNSRHIGYVPKVIAAKVARLTSPRTLDDEDYPELIASLVSIKQGTDLPEVKFNIFVHARPAE